jgi:hypothetical protein
VKKFPTLGAVMVLAAAAGAYAHNLSDAHRPAGEAATASAATAAAAASQTAFEAARHPSVPAG